MTNLILFLAVLCGGAWLAVGLGLANWGADWCSAAPSLCENPQPLGSAAVALTGLWIAVRVAMSAAE
ncbi:MAG: hypothetical protein WAK55_04870 [Xanthobacteraceae bacterium]